jgi:hypothetical protein
MRFLLLSAALFAAISLRADTEDDLRRQINTIATSLTAGDATSALTPFSKDWRDYETLHDYFTGLTGAFSISNEVDMLEEEDTDTEASAKLRWAITLSDPQTNFSEHRAAELSVRFKLTEGKWKIIEFKPIDIFRPTTIAPRHDTGFG